MTSDVTPIGTMRRRKLIRSVERTARQLRAAANRATFNGEKTPENFEYLNSCSRAHEPTRVQALFTRDELPAVYVPDGPPDQPSQWRFFHLSLAPIQGGRVLAKPTGLDVDTMTIWARAVFGEHVGSVWVDSPKTPRNIAIGVWHFRLFVDESWTEPVEIELGERSWRIAGDVLELGDDQGEEFSCKGCGETVDRVDDSGYCVVCSPVEWN